MISHLAVAAAAGGAAAAATPLVRRLALRLGAVDLPDGRKVHDRPTPTLGGLAIFLAVLAGLGVAWLLPTFDDLFRTSTEPLGVLIAASALVLLGVVDDLRGLGAATKLAGQVLAAGILVLAGVQFFYFWLPGVGLVSLSTDVSAILTVMWTVAIINALNLIDGLDGLAAGVAIIAACGFFAYAYLTAGGSPTVATMLSAAVVGACAGFLRYNFNPARIFMGDAGSMLLGLLLAAATVSGVGRTTEPQLSDVAGLIFPVLLPAIVLAIPLADAGLAIMRRVRGRRPVFHPDKRHIHHWLLEMATSHRRAVLVMYLWSALMAGAALSLALDSGRGGRAAAVLLGIALVASVVGLPRLLRRIPPSPPARDPIHNPASGTGPT